MEIKWNDGWVENGSQMSPGVTLLLQFYHNLQLHSLHPKTDKVSHCFDSLFHNALYSFIHFIQLHSYLS